MTESLRAAVTCIIIIIIIIIIITDCYDGIKLCRNLLTLSSSGNLSPFSYRAGQMYPGAAWQPPSGMRFIVLHRYYNTYAYRAVLRVTDTNSNE